MKRINLRNLFAWTATHISWLTMVISPVAIGKQSEHISEQITVEFLKSSIKDFGLHQKITLAEFWQKTKANYPGYLYKDIEAFVQKNPHMLMPQVEVKTAKNSQGVDVPVLSLSENGKIQTIQFFSEADKLIKFNNVNITEDEILVPNKMLKKLFAEDSKLHLQYTQKNAIEKAKSINFPVMTQKLWKTLSMEQRVTYFIQMRLMYLDAQKVISEKEGSKKTSAFPFFEYIIKNLIPDVDAQVQSAILPKVQGKKVITKQGKQVQIPYNAKSCIVAGYIGAYTADVNNVRGDKRQGCSVDVAIATYNDKDNLSYVKDSNDFCVKQSGSNFVACNPMVYGTPNGKPICIGKKDSTFQKATHWEGPCDMQSRLSKNHPLFDLNGKDYSQIQPREKQIEMIRKDQAGENFQLTKDFIAGVLASKDESLLKLFQNGDWSETLEAEIRRISYHFKATIDRSLEICEKEITAKHEINQRGACDQLHRRYLFVDEVIAGLKKPGVPLSSLVAQPEVKSEPVFPQVSDDHKCGKPLGIASYDYEKCDCSEGTLEVANEPGHIAKFFGAKSPAMGEEVYECKSGPNWLLVGGLMAGALILMALLNKKTKAPPVTPPVVVPPSTCTLPKVIIQGSCGCSNTCTLPAEINPESCVCAAPPSEGGSGTNTCVIPPCSGGVPAVQ